jgi:hypothetical protein
MAAIARPKTKNIMKAKTGYLHRRKAVFLNHPEFIASGATMVETIAHDARCRIYKRKPCNCVPDITLTVDGVAYDVDGAGNANARS